MTIFILFFYTIFSCTPDETNNTDEGGTENLVSPSVLEENTDTSLTNEEIEPLVQIGEILENENVDATEENVNATEENVDATEENVDATEDFLIVDEKQEDIGSFPKEYGVVEQWETIYLAQVGTDVSMLRDANEDFLILLEKNVELDYMKSLYFPNDVIIGSLEDQHQNDSRVKEIFKLLDDFIFDMRNEKIEENLAKYVSNDEVTVVSRQISYSQNYGKYISSYRLGKFVLIDSKKVSAQLRILAELPNFEARVKVRIYFTRIDGRWYISVIEGDLNELVDEYTADTVFEPSGVLGISQGF